MENENALTGAENAEKARLWKKFTQSGRIEDYLAYSRFGADRS